MTTDIEALIRRLRDVATSYHPACDEAADALRSQAERIQALEADKASLHAEIRDWYKATKEWAERSEALEAKCAELERDRARYQWLANRVLGCDYGDNDALGQQIGWRICHDLLRSKDGGRQPAFMFGSSIDAAIDAAIAAQADQSEAS